MKLRKFNKQGVEAFRNELANCRNNPALRPDRQLLENDKLTEIVRDVDLPRRIFSTKGEAGLFLRDVFQQAGLTTKTLMTDTGLWTWLSLYYFDSICRNRNGKYKIKADTWYIFEPQAAGHKKWNSLVHPLFVSWRVMQDAKNTEYCRMISTTAPFIQDSTSTEIMKRLALIRIPCIFEVLDKIYWNEADGKVRNTAFSQDSAGSLLRLPVVIAQLSLTYDMQSLDADKLIELLGDEFKF